MRKECVILNGQVINIGPWDDMGGINPMPDGAVIEEREIEIGPDGGLYVVGEPRPETPEQKIARLESELTAVKENNLTACEAIAELYEMMLAQGGGTT